MNLLLSFITNPIFAACFGSNLFDILRQRQRSPRRVRGAVRSRCTAMINSNGSPVRSKRLRVGGLDYNEANALLRPGPASRQELDAWDRLGYIILFLDTMPQREEAPLPPHCY